MAYRFISCKKVVSSGTTDSVESFYDINGTKKVNLSKGLNIVRMKDGRTKKVVVR